MATKRSGLTLPGALILAALISIGISLTVQSQSVPVGTIGNKNGQVTILGKRVTVFELPISLAAADARYARVAFNNTFTTSHNTFTSPTASPILIKPSSACVADTILFDMQATGAGATNFNVDCEGDVRTHNIATTNGNLTMTNGSITLNNGYVSAGGSSFLNGLTTNAVTVNGAEVITGSLTVPAIIASGSQTNVTGNAGFVFQQTTGPAVSVTNAVADGSGGAALAITNSNAGGHASLDLMTDPGANAAFVSYSTSSSSALWAAGMNYGTDWTIKDQNAGSARLTINKTTGKVAIGTALFYSTLPPVYANNAAAIVGGLVAGDTYRTGANPDPLMIVH